MNTYTQSKKEYIDHFGKPEKKSMIILYVTLVSMVITIIISILNMYRMRSASSEYVMDYVTDITYQMAETLNTSQDDMKNMLAGVNKSITMFTEDGIYQTSEDSYIQSYLDKSVQSTKFNYLIFLKYDGSSIRSGSVPQDISDRINNGADIVQEVMKNGTIAAYIDDDDVYYAQTIYTNGYTVGTLVGGIHISSLKDIINNTLYQDKSVFAITNLDGKILVNSDSDTFDELEDTLKVEDSRIDSIKEDFSNQIAGLAEITIHKQKYYISYAPVEGEDWMLITLIADDAFSSIYLSYMVTALVITIGSIIIFIVLLFLIFHANRKNRIVLEKLAFTDDITGGNNDMEFHLRYHQLQRNADPSQYSIVMLDVRDFKLINESIGFVGGDIALKKIYEGICSQLHEEEYETVARTEMDHFMLCIKENTTQGIQKRIDEIIQHLNVISVTEDNTFRISFKEGACIITSLEEDISKLEECARIARQNQDPEHPNTCSFYSESMHDKLYENMKIDHMAAESLSHHDFLVYFQPKVSLSSHEIKGAEALVRWNHPTKGFITPDCFVPILEDTGRIQDVDTYVFEEVCRWLEKRQQQHKQIFPVSINLSRLHFWQTNFLQEYLDILDKYHVDKKYIIFEITETVFMEEEKHKRIKDGIDQMHANGFICSVDDFGVGYSSLSLVHDMDVDELKFDRSFFTNLEDMKAQKIASSLINMADELQLKTVIEGIETKEQIDFLKQQSCDVIQGYYYSPPLPEKEFEKWIDDFNEENQNKR